MMARPDQRTSSGSTSARVALAHVFLEREIGQRIPPVQELQQALGTGTGTVVKAMRGLQEAGAVALKARGHQGTTITDRHVGRLWNEGQLGNLRLVMPPPGPIEQLGILRSLKDVFGRMGIPLVADFVSGAKSRMETVYHERAHAAITSVAAFGTHASDLLGLTSVDLGESTYYAHGSLVVIERSGSARGTNPRVGIDRGSYDHEQLTEQEFGHLDPEYIDCPFVQAPAKVLAGEVDFAVWHRMPTVIPPELAGLTLRPLAAPSALALVARLSRGAIVTRALDAATNAVLREVKPAEIVRCQQELQRISEDNGSNSVLWPG